MRSIGKSDFQGGQTTIKRLAYNNGAALEKCNGFDPSDGSLAPEPVTAKIVTNGNITLLCPEQTPALFRESDANQFAVFSSDGQLCRSLSGDIVSDGDITPVSGSIPTKLGPQIVVPTLDGVVAYEPGSPTTKLRPLSIKSPHDYNDASYPLVTNETWAGIKLITGIAPVSSGTGVTPTFTTGAVTLSMASAGVDVANPLAVLSSGVGVNVVGKSWLLLDVSITGDIQQYTIDGCFTNDPLLRPSGYYLQLCSDGAGTTPIAGAICRIPRLAQNGRVYRVAFNVGNLATVGSVRVMAETWWIPPTSGTADVLKIYTEDYADAWTHKGNFLLPAPKWDDASLTTILTSTTNLIQQNVIDTTNRVLEPSFEVHPESAAWAINGDLVATGGHLTSNGYASLKNESYVNNHANLVEQSITLVSGHTYTLKFWAYRPVESPENTFYARVYARLEYDISGGTKEYQFLPSGYVQTTNTMDDTLVNAKANMWTGGQAQHLTKTNQWEEVSFTFAVPANITATTLRIVSAPSPYDTTLQMLYPGWIPNANGHLYLDDVSVTETNFTAAGTTIIIANMSDSGTDILPGYDQVKYCYAFAGKPLLAGYQTNVMISNPGNESKSVVCSPWSIPSVSINLPLDADSHTVITDYGDYITHLLIYRSMYDGATETWGMWTLVSVPAVGSTVIVSDNATTKPDSIPGKDALSLPLELQITNDFGPSAKFACVSESRVYLGCLNYNNDAWASPTAIQVSSWRKPWAFPAIVDEYSVATDGELLDDYAVNGTAIRGLIAYNGDKLVFLDNEYFLLRGDNASDGWRFSRIDSIGCVSGRTIANCRSIVIWHDGLQFYAFTGGSSICLSKHKIDSTKINFGYPHNAVFCGDKYVLFCRYNEANALLIRDSETGAWRIRQSVALATIQGITTDGLSAFGVTSAGHIIDLFNGLSDWTETTAREATTQYHIIGEPDSDICIKGALIEAETTEEDGVDIQVTWTTQGAKNATVGPITIKLTPDQTRYRHNLNLYGNAIKTKIVYVGETPPTIYHIGVGLDEDSRE